MNLSNAAESLNAILHLAVLVAWACALLLIDLFVPKEGKGWTALLSAVGLLVSLVLTDGTLDSTDGQDSVET